MNLDEAILGRHTVRRFSDKSVDDELIKKLIEAAIYAPSACNLQNWKYIVVEDKNRSIYANEILTNAPQLIFVCYRNDVNNVSGYKHKDYVQSAAASIQNILLKAYSEGLGACWVCDLPDEDSLRKCFNVPEYYDVLAAVAIGYPAECENTYAQKMFHNNENDQIRKRKYSVEQVLYREKYGQPFGEEKVVETFEEINSVRNYWVSCMLKIATPVLKASSNDILHETMPLYTNDKKRGEKYSHLEALGRTILGIAPWLELEESNNEIKEEYRKMARQAITNAVDPDAKDYMNWNEGDQPLVDAAFFAMGILNARVQLWEKLSEKTQRELLNAIKSTRRILPWRSNWILFSSIIEVFVYIFEGEEFCVKSVIDYGISQFEEWYVGDGFYKDGDIFHFDYYESIVIHPFLLEISKDIPWIDEKKYRNRAMRYAKLLEASISKDGSFPLVGRSLCYRGGVLYLLSKIIQEDMLDENAAENISISAAEIRTSLMSVLNRLMASDIFDKDGWLLPGVVGYQPSLAEEYINTGSLYMFTSMFVCTGRAEQDSFWNDDKSCHKSDLIWQGNNVKADSSLEGWKRD